MWLITCFLLGILIWAFYILPCLHNSFWKSSSFINLFFLTVNGTYIYGVPTVCPTTLESMATYDEGLGLYFKVVSILRSNQHLQNSVTMKWKLHCVLMSPLNLSLLPLQLITAGSVLTGGEKIINVSNDEDSFVDPHCYEPQRAIYFPV